MRAGRDFKGRLVMTSRLRLTEDPHGLLHEVIGEFVAEADGCIVGSTGESSLQGGNVFTLGLCEPEATTIELSS